MDRQHPSPANRCDVCGRFFSPGQPGSSWSQSWHHDMAGDAVLEDPTDRCAICTEKLGVKPSNCGGAGPWNGQHPPQSPGDKARDDHNPKADGEQD